MKSVFQPGAAASVVAVLLAALVVLFLAAPAARPALWLYPLARQAVYLKIDYATRDMLVKESEHFIIKYHPADATAVNMVILAAEAAYEPVGNLIGYQPRKKSLIIVYQDRAAMQGAYGWSNGGSAMGFYWGGVIQVLSPLAWLHDKTSFDEFARKGPMAHEYTHLVLDFLLKGNYPRWFTEGVAQYAEYALNGYEWLTQYNSLTQKCYTLAELEKNFDELPNQALAYRQSLAIVRYIIENHGEERFMQILSALRNGVKTEKAIKDSLGFGYAELEIKTALWAQKSMTAKLTG